MQRRTPHAETSTQRGHIIGALLLALFLGGWLYADRATFFGPMPKRRQGVSVRVNEIPTGRAGSVDAATARALVKE